MQNIFSQYSGIQTDLINTTTKGSLNARASPQGTEEIDRGEIIKHIETFKRRKLTIGENTHLKVST